MQEHTEPSEKIINHLKMEATPLKIRKSKVVLHKTRPKSDYSSRDVAIYNHSGKIKVHWCHHEMRPGNIKAKKGRPDLKKATKKQRLLRKEPTRSSETSFICSCWRFLLRGRHQMETSECIGACTRVCKRDGRVDIYFGGVPTV